MFEQKDHIKQIQEITFEAYKASGRIAVLLENGDASSEALAKELEQAAAQIEQGAVELRTLCAHYQLPLPPVGVKPALEPLNIMRPCRVQRIWLAPYSAQLTASQLPLCKSPVDHRHHNQALGSVGTARGKTSFIGDSPSGDRRTL